MDYRGKLEAASKHPLAASVYVRIWDLLDPQIGPILDRLWGVLARRSKRRELLRHRRQSELSGLSFEQQERTLDEWTGWSDMDYLRRDERLVELFDEYFIEVETLEDASVTKTLTWLLDEGGQRAVMLKEWVWGA